MLRLVGAQDLNAIIRFDIAVSASKFLSIAKLFEGVFQSRKTQFRHRLKSARYFLKVQRKHLIRIRKPQSKWLKTLNTENIEKQLSSKRFADYEPKLKCFDVRVLMSTGTPGPLQKTPRPSIDGA